LYADDILILSPTVSKLHELLNVIECELQALDLTINSQKHIPGIFVFLYADDILILSPTVSKLHELLNVIECELQALDLTINSQKNLVVYVSVLDAT